MASNISAARGHIYAGAGDVSLKLNHPFGVGLFKETGVELGYLDLFLMSPLCRHLHNQLLSAHV